MKNLLKIKLIFQIQKMYLDRLFSTHWKSNNSIGKLEIQKCCLFKGCDSLMCGENLEKICNKFNDNVPFLN